MVVRDALLSLFTLSLYRSWARINWRKKIVPSIRMLGEPLAFDGTGVGLFVREFPFVAAIAIVFCAIFLSGSGMSLFVSISIYVLTVPALMAALFYARSRYFISCMVWRGVRYRFVGEFGEWFSSGSGQGSIGAVLGIFRMAFSPARILARATDQIEFAGQKFACSSDFRTPMPVLLSNIAGVLLFTEWLNIHAVEAYLNFITQRAPLFDMSAFETVRFVLIWPLLFISNGLFAVSEYRSRMEGTTLGPMRYATNIPTLPFVAKRAVGSFAILAFAAAIFGVLPLLADLSGAEVLQRVYMFCFAIALSITVRTIVRDAWIDPWVLEYLYAQTWIENPDHLLALVERQNQPTSTIP